MPNIKSASKRVLIAKVRNAANKADKSELRTSIKKFDTAVDTGADAQVAYKEAVKTIDKAVSKGILHKNNAARKKSRLTVKLNAAAAK